MNNVERLIEPDQIKLLLAVADARNLSAVAAAFGITASSVSQQVKRLEGLAGCALFRRMRRGVEPTRECETLLFYARAMSELTNDLRRQFQHTAATDSIRIGMAEDFCRSALPAILNLLSLQFPDLDLHILSGSYDLISQAIEDRTLDLAIVRRWDRFPEAMLLWSDEQVWYGHRRFEKGVVDPVPLVAPLAPNPTRLTLIDALRRDGRTWKIRFESVGMTGIESALQCGFGLCAGPRHMPMHGVTIIGPDSGLPHLPPVEFVMLGPSPKAGGIVQAVSQLLHQLAVSGFKPYSR